MSKAVKKMMIDDLRNRVGDSRDFVIVDVSKMDANSNNTLRLELAKKGINLLGVKNSLFQVVLRESGQDTMDETLAGPSVVAWGGEDIVGLSREMASWAKKISELEIKGGSVDGQQIDSEGVAGISKGPSRIELIGQISGLLLSPGSMVAGALLGPGGTLSGQVQALADKDENSEEESGDAA